MSAIYKVLMVTVFFGVSAISQVTTGTISGTVKDSTGGVVPGVSIVIKNVDTGISRTVSTDAAGHYLAPQLGLGRYDVTAESTGFQSTVRSGIALTVGREAVVDFTLQVGAVAEQVTVTGEAPLVNATNATVSGLVDEKALRDLPLNGRSYADLTTIQPGVVSDLEMTSTSTTSVYTGGGSATRRSIGGTKPAQSEYLLDGVEMSTPSEGMPVNSVLGQQLGVDAIREFTLMQSNYGAQFGRAAGGVVNAVTQSGTNTFHGSAFEFLRNDSLDARGYFALSKLPKAPLSRNQFGGSLGGPIQKDRTFFFLNYEGLRQSGGDTFLGSSLTPEARVGDLVNADGSITHLDVDPNMVPLMNLLPLPNGDYIGAGAAQFFDTPRYEASENYGIARFDQQISSTDSLFGRITVDQSHRTDHLEFLTPEPWTGYQIGGYILAAVSEVHVINPAVLNSFRIGFTRRNDRLLYNYSRGGDQFPDAPGLDPRLSPVKGVPMGLFAVPGVDFYGISATQVGPSLSGPAVFVDNTFEYDDSVIISHGRHSLTVGANLKRYRMNELNEPWVYGGVFSWQNITRFLTNRPFRTTQLIGFSVPGSQIADVYRGWRQTYGAWYVQDDFKVSSNLTLNLGMRWENISSPREVNGKLAVLKDIYNDKDFTLLKKSDAYFSLRDGLKGFSPRVGFAWSPRGNGNTVFRAGFGAFKEMPLEYVYQLANEAPPYSKRYVVNSPLLKYPFPFEDESILTSAGAGGPLMMPLDIKIPYTMQWTASVERQIGSTLVVKANYVGTRGVDLFAIYNPNQPPTTIEDGRQFTPTTSKAPNPNYTSFRYVAPISNQYYSAGQLVVEKRFSGGLSFNASYTLAKNLDNGGGAGTKGAENVGGTGFNVSNGYDRAADKGLSPLHIKHNFIFSYTYELPMGRGHRWGDQWRALPNAILGGWVINGTSSIRSGLPVNVNGVSRRSRCPAECAQRPDLIPGGNNNPVLDKWTPEHYFDPTQFVLQPAGFFGNVGRNTLIRPGVTNLNFSLTKDNSIGEGKNVEFRAEFFNILNHPNFGAPNASIFQGSSGARNPGAGRITSTSTSMRQIQLGFKLTF